MKSINRVSLVLLFLVSLYTIQYYPSPVQSGSPFKSLAGKSFHQSLSLPQCSLISPASQRCFCGPSSRSCEVGETCVKQSSGGQSQSWCSREDLPLWTPADDSQCNCKQSNVCYYYGGGYGVSAGYDCAPTHPHQSCQLIKCYDSSKKELVESALPNEFNSDSPTYGHFWPVSDNQCVPKCSQPNICYREDIKGYSFCYRDHPHEVIQIENNNEEQRSTNQFDSEFQVQGDQMSDLSPVPDSWCFSPACTQSNSCYRDTLNGKSVCGEVHPPAIMCGQALCGTKQYCKKYCSCWNVECPIERCSAKPWDIFERCADL